MYVPKKAAFRERMVKWGKKKVTAHEIFQDINVVFLTLLSILCIAPLIHVLAISFSDSLAAQTGDVTFFPIGFNITAYQFLIANNSFWRAMWISVQRIILGGGLTILLTILTAYPMSRRPEVFPYRKYYIWFMFFTMLFGGGLIPSFLLINNLGLMNSIWALVLPGAVSVWNIILMLNFFRQLPKELDEAAFIDGATHWTVLWKIYVPTSKAVIATVTLFTVVGQWNAWFDGMIYMTQERFPLQTFLYFTLQAAGSLEMLNEAQQMEAFRHLTQDTLQAAQIFIGALPVIMLYPFLQKYFTKGIVLGSVKG